MIKRAQIIIFLIFAICVYESNNIRSFGLERTEQIAEGGNN